MGRQFGLFQWSRLIKAIHARPCFYKTARSARALPIPAAVEATKHAARSIHKVCCVNKKRIFANYKSYK